MGLFDFLKKSDKFEKAQDSPSLKSKFADASSITDDERPFYQPDEYYTYVTHPDTQFETRVVTFEERKGLSYPSQAGLYVPEILLLEYCSYGTYPKPSNGYPGFWWFKYGIRDIGAALKSLEQRGFIEWASKEELLESLKIDDLKMILKTNSLPVSGTKNDLLIRIRERVPIEQWPNHLFPQKYRLTVSGKSELIDNQYVPYMHKHKHATTEDGTSGETFTVWDMNKLVARNGRQAEWKKIIGDIEQKRFGVNMAASVDDDLTQKQAKKSTTKKVDDETSITFQRYLIASKAAIKAAARTAGDGFEEESKGLDYLQIGKDKEAIFQLMVAIEKKFDAPALYREAAKLLRKYNLYEEEISVLKAGIKNVPVGNRHRAELEKRLNTLQSSLNK